MRFLRTLDSTMKTFEELSDLINKNKEVWVLLNDDLRICLIGIVGQPQTFSAKFLPCAKNSAVYNIPYSKIKSLIEKHKEESD